MGHDVTAVGEFLTAITVRLAVGFYVIRFVAELAFGDQTAVANQRVPRWLFSVGLLFYLIHVACAFHFYHDWSHSDAYLHTANVTLKTVGWESGVGLYFNYLYSLMWFGDVAVWWLRPDWRSRGVRWSLQAIHFFMIINATVVFGPDFWKPVAAMIFAGLFCIWLIIQLTSVSKE